MGIEDLPLEQITSVHTSLTKLVIAAGGHHEVDLRAVANVDQVAASIREAMTGYGPAPQQSPPQAAATSPDVYDQLRKIGELRTAGILTDEEFAAQKAKLLNSLN